MALPYRALTRSVRSSVQASFRRSSSAVRNPLARGTRNPAGNDIRIAIFQRRFSCISRLPAELGSALHRAVADAKLISHLSVSSRTCSALSLEHYRLQIGDVLVFTGCFNINLLLKFFDGKGLQCYVDAADELRVGLHGNALIGPIAILPHSV